MDTKNRKFDVQRESFFSAEVEDDVHLMVLTVQGMPSGGKVYCGTTPLLISDGDRAREFFYNMAAKQEADFAIMRARVRALTGFKP